ncbi:MAG: VIT and VWA domain-containing protein, partial [Acidobacteriota bacterium]|nr:VIT and VWA domain-containing protein [Acidobacteriota bacterium]
MSTAASFAPLAVATGQPLKLAMQRLWVTGQILPAGARLSVRHLFRSDEEKPLEVIYAFPLPRDAAMRRFRISGEGFEAHSELRETGAAVKSFEDGIAQGSLSALARQYGDGLVNLTVGNIRPKETVTVDLEILAGVELRDDGFRFRFPFTLAPAYHARAKAIAAQPGEGEMELPADEFGDVILPRFRDDAAELHRIGFDLSVVSRLEIEEIGSPSHGLRVKRDRAGSARVALAPEKDVPNRDLVLDASFREVRPQVLAARTGSGKAHFAAVVPSSSFGTTPESARRVLILLDRSGSMQGEAIEQARRAIEACLSLLSDRDSFGLVAFDDHVETFQPALVPGTRQFRDRAHEFLRRIGARGGTELATALTESAKLFNGAGGDLLILTDGQVSGTEHILAAARGAKIRLHCLGIGSASQDRFLTLLARETGGVSRFVTPRERIDLSAVDLFASIGRPVVSGLKAGANVQPEAPAAVFCRTPVQLFGELDEAGPHEIELAWDGGSLKIPVTVEEDGKLADTIRLLQGSRLITDWESRYPS